MIESNFSNEINFFSLSFSLTFTLDFSLGYLISIYMEISFKEAS